MTHKWVGIALAVATLAACDPAAKTPDPDNPFAPGLADGEAVDGLIVGHRLMAAGEYELALNAYARAVGDQGFSPDVLSALGSANLKLGRLNQSEDLLRRATREEPEFVPAWNNLGVVLMEKGETVEARQVFRHAYALDSGNSDQIRDNLRLAIAKTENSAYEEDITTPYQLVRRGSSDFLILQTP